MAKLYFKFGAMGSSKTANALMTKFNYEEKGKRVLLLKPSIDTRDGDSVVSSRIGLFSPCEMIEPDVNIEEYILENHLLNNDEKFRDFNILDFDVIIVDECQFLSREQVVNLRNIASFWDVSVLCYGLRTDFRCNLFSGSKALFELADSISEIKSVCKCGKKAIINARVDKNGNIIKDGEQVQIGGNESYVSMCYDCYNFMF